VAYSQIAGECIIHTPWRLEAPASAAGWSFWFGSGGTEVTTGDGDNWPSHKGVRCYKKLGNAFQNIAEPAHTYANVGKGWCRGSGATSAAGYKKEDTFTDSRCRRQCDSDKHCIAYNQESEQCLIYSGLSKAPDGWSSWSGSGTGGTDQVKTGDGWSSVTCYKKIVKQVSDGSRRLSAAAADAGQAFLV